MKIKLKNPEISTTLVVLSIVTIVMLGPQLLSQNTIAQPTGANSTERAAGVTPKLNATKSVSIPVSTGYVNGKIGYFIATDASDPQIAASITNTTGFKVNFSPILALSPESSRQQGYDFINGVKQSGSPMGFQLGVSSASPGEKGYSPLYALNFVKWNAKVNPRILKSASEVLSAERNGELTISKTGIVINSPEVTPGR